MNKEDFIQRIEKLSIKNGIYRVFDDFCTLSASAISANCGNRETEKRYLDTIVRYNKAEQQIFVELFAVFSELVRMEPYKDLLGELYMNLKISQGNIGQFFTPQHISNLTAELSHNKKELINEVVKKGIIKFKEPACGGGGLPLGFAKKVMKEGLNPQKIVEFHCNDIDPLCVNMTYIQMSLNGLKAEVTRGNGLNYEILEKHITPALYEERK